MDGPWMPIRRRVTVQIPRILRDIFFGSPFDCIFAACLSHLLRECGFSSRSCNCRQLLWLHPCPRPSYVPFLVASVTYNTKLKPDNSSSSRYRARSCGNRLMVITGETMATIVSTFSRVDLLQDRQTQMITSLVIFHKVTYAKGIRRFLSCGVMG